VRLDQLVRLGAGTERRNEQRSKAVFRWVLRYIGYNRDMSILFDVDSGSVTGVTNLAFCADGASKLGDSLCDQPVGLQVHAGQPALSSLIHQPDERVRRSRGGEAIFMDVRYAVALGIPPAGSRLIG
jgi:hypothetical protein